MTVQTKRAPGGSRMPKDSKSQEGTAMPITDGSPILARTTDPGTSHAAVPARQKREEQKNAILWLLENVGPMTDHELQFQYKRLRAEHNWPATQLDSVRKRRSELKNERRVVATDRVSGIGGGPASVVWASAWSGAQS